MKFTRLVCTGLALSISTASVVGFLYRPAQAEVINSRRALAQTVRELNVEAIALSKTLDFLRDVSGANIVVNWKVLEQVGVAKETPITMNVRELSLRKMLQLVLDQASPNAPLVYSIDSNVIQITTQEDADKVMITKVYDVADLIMVPANKTAPTGGLTGISSAGGIGGGASGGFGGSGNGGGFGSGSSGYSGGGASPFGGSSGGGGFGSSGGGGGFGSSGGGGGQQQTPQKTAQQRGDDLVTLIEEVVRPSIWTINGGTASIKFFNGKLIVTAPVSVQEAIGGPVDSGGIFSK